MTKAEILNTKSGKISGQIFYLTVSNIDWDTDGEDIEDLPKKLSLDIDDFDDDFDFNEDLSDWLTDNFDWMVNGYDFTWETEFF